MTYTNHILVVLDKAFGKASLVEEAVAVVVVGEEEVVAVVVVAAAVELVLPL